MQKFDSTKPLPEPVLTYQQSGPLTFIWGHQSEDTNHKNNTDNFLFFSNRLQAYQGQKYFVCNAFTKYIMITKSTSLALDV